MRLSDARRPMRFVVETEIAPGVWVYVLERSNRLQAEAWVIRAMRRLSGPYRVVTAFPGERRAN